MPLYEASFFHLLSASEQIIFVLELPADVFSCAIKLRTKESPVKFQAVLLLLPVTVLRHRQPRQSDTSFRSFFAEPPELPIKSLLIQPFNDIFRIILRTDMHLYFRRINVFKTFFLLSILLK